MVALSEHDAKKSHRHTHRVVSVIGPWICRLSQSCCPSNKEMPVTVSLSGTMSSGSGLKAEVTPTSALDLNRNTMTAALLPRVTQTRGSSVYLVVQWTASEEIKFSLVLQYLKSKQTNKHSCFLVLYYLKCPPMRRQCPQWPTVWHPVIRGRSVYRSREQC